MPPVSTTCRVGDWERGIRAERNAVVVSIPSVLDPSMAPAGRHVLHAYTPANEPWELWQGLERESPEYQQLRTERCQVFWMCWSSASPTFASAAMW